MAAELATVSELTAAIKGSLERTFPEVHVEGEVSNFRPAASGHWYFTLKDDNAQIDAVLFRGNQRGVAAPPRDGQLVRARGTLSVYARRGRYQVICSTLQPSGEGAILAMLSERRRRLAAEGLFDEDRKIALPRYPRRVALVTSPSGAAVRDFLSVLKRRNVAVSVTVYPTLVQGDEAAAKIANQVVRADSHQLADVIVVSRGGGSLEDLLPFSAESVVRAIADVSIPVISAVGHQVDYTIADLAADIRAPTPTAAAEILADCIDELRASIVDTGRDVARRFLGRLSDSRRRLDRFSTDEMLFRYRNFMQPWYQRLDEARYRLTNSMTTALERSRRRVESATDQLHALSPRKVLERGYAIVRTVATEGIVDSAQTTTDGDIVRIEWHDGQRLARIDGNSKEN